MIPKERILVTVRTPEFRIESPAPVLAIDYDQNKQKFVFLVVGGFGRLYQADYDDVDLQNIPE